MARIIPVLCLLLALLLPVCAAAEEPPAEIPAEAVIPCPVISRRVPAYALVNNWSARSGNDDYYSGAWSGKAPDWLAYDLSGVPEENRRTVAAVWYNPSSWDQLGQWASRARVPSDYCLEVNAAPGGVCPEEGWTAAVTVTGNVRGARMHVLDMTGCNWIRLRVTAADGKADGACEVNFDVHDLSRGGNDTWLFLGDSITAGAMNNCYGTGFATFVNRMRPAYFPLQINGGIGGLTSRDGRAHIGEWLADFPGRYVVIAYGTNDAWGGVGAGRYYENTAAMVEAVTAAGKIPVVPRIPYSTEPGVLRNLADYNAQVDRLYEDYPQIVPGPDFEAVLREHPEYLGPDGVHPSSAGYENMRRIWAQTMAERVYPAPDGRD